MVNLYELTLGKDVYLEEGKRIDIDELEIRFDKVIGWSYCAKINGEWYVINMTDDECKIIVTDKVRCHTK